MVPESDFRVGGDVPGGADDLHVADEAAARVADAAVVDEGGEEPDAAGVVVVVVVIDGGGLGFGGRVGELVLEGG